MKVAISVPDQVFDAAERLAKQRSVPRSRVFAEALEEYVSRYGTEAVTDRLDAVYAVEQHSGVEPVMMQAQLGSVADEAW
jgi:metal-responsive CopG/Arc/MetJ family transcriptional regulator